MVCGLWTSGCLHRSLTIRTEPPGALVYVNDQLKGESPVTYDFQWYGWHRFSIRKDGYERLDDNRLLRCPPSLWIPFDLAMELMPFPVRDQRTWSYTLTPAPELPTPVPPPLISQRASPSAPAEPAVETVQPQESQPLAAPEPTAEQTTTPTQESTDAPR